MVAQAMYAGIPAGAMGRPAAVYPASVGAGSGAPMAMVPVQAANAPYYSAANVSVLPPNYGYVGDPATRPARAAGGAMGDVGVSVAGAAANLGMATKMATNVLAHNVIPAGGIVTAGMEAWGGSRTKMNTIADMVEGYREVVADQLGISPQSVDADALRKAAENNPVLKEALDALQDGVGWRPVISGAASAVGLVAGTAATGVGGIATMIGAQMATDKLMNTIVGTKEIGHTIHGKVTELKGKLEAGELLSARDVFGLHVRMNGELANKIEDLMGKKFQDLDAEKQAKAMFYFAELTQMATQEAYLVNSGQLKPEMLPFIPLNTIAATMNPMLAQAVEPMTPPLTSVGTQGAQVSYLQPRAQVQGQAGGGAFAATVAAQRAAANEAGMNQPQVG